MKKKYFFQLPNRWMNGIITVVLLLLIQCIMSSYSTCTIGIQLVKTSPKASKAPAMTKDRILSDKDYLEYIDSIQHLIPSTKTWFNAEKLDPDSYFGNFLYMKWDELERNKNAMVYKKPYYYISASYYESYLKQYFKVSSGFLQKGKHYSVANHAYLASDDDLGFGAPGEENIIKSIKREGNNQVAITVDYYEVDQPNKTLIGTYTYHFEQSTKPFKIIGFENITKK